MLKKAQGNLIRWCAGAGRDGRNRRASRRFAVLSRPAQVGWFEGERFETAAVSLKDVSLTGVSALSDAPFPAAADVWVALGDQPAGRWVKAVVVDVKRARGLLTFRKSPYLIRMRFGLGCPYTFFRDAVGGTPDVAPAPRPAAVAKRAGSRVANAAAAARRRRERKRRMS